VQYIDFTAATGNCAAYLSAQGVAKPKPTTGSTGGTMSSSGCDFAGATPTGALFALLMLLAVARLSRAAKP
jgi:hypothetical protein